jgi:hypothetical protein
MKKWLVVLGITAIVVLYGWIMFSSFYVVPVSEGKLESGRFGDFFGTINAFISLLTLLATVYVAFELSSLEKKREEQRISDEKLRTKEAQDLEERRHNHNIHFERKRLLTELREAEYRKISTILSQLDTDSTREELLSIRFATNHFFFNNGHLFPTKDDNFMSICTESLKGFYEVTEYNGLLTKEVFGKAVFSSCRFLEIIQKFMLDELEK